MKRSHTDVARLAGMFYLAVIVFGLFTQFFARANFIVDGDALATTNNVIANLDLFRLGLVTDLISHSLYFLLALTLYKLLKPVNKTLAILFLLMVSINVAVLNVNMFSHLAIMLLLGEGNNIASMLNLSEVSTSVMFLLDMHKYGYVIAQLYFAGWLLPLGYIIKKSELFPKVWGWLIMLAGVLYGLDFFAVFLVPSFSAVTNSLTGIAFGLEFLFCLWLIFRGAKTS